MYFGEINRGKGAEEGLGIIIFSQLAKTAQKCKNSDESKEPQVVSKIADGFKIPSNCPNVRVPVLNEVVAVKAKVMPYHKRADEQIASLQKWNISVAAKCPSCVKNGMADELFLAEKDSWSPDLEVPLGIQ